MKLDKDTINILGTGITITEPGQVNVLSCLMPDNKEYKWVVLGVPVDLVELDDASIVYQLGVEIDEDSTGHEFLNHETLLTMTEDLTDE